jgi:NAD(P)-dependent dehydrogenase (short-subunit alcohol dehydrogenase family)
MSLKNKTAIITGAGRGLGKSIATAFAREGANVMMMSLDEGELKNAVKDIEPVGSGKIITHAGDVSNENDVSETVEKTLAYFQGIDILVNNAGIIGPPRFLEDTDVTNWNVTIGVNLGGFFLFTRAVLPHMVEKRRGKIINIVSGLGEMPFPRFCAYSVSKAGGIQLTRSIASEMGPYGIQVNAIDPGVMDTDMQETIRRLGSDVLGKDVYRQFKEYRESNLLKSPDDVAPLAVFLASGASDHITGQIGSMRFYQKMGWKP